MGRLMGSRAMNLIRWDIPWNATGPWTRESVTWSDLPIGRPLGKPRNVEQRSCDTGSRDGMDLMEFPWDVP